MQRTLAERYLLPLGHLGGAVAPGTERPLASRSVPSRPRRTPTMSNPHPTATSTRTAAPEARGSTWATPMTTCATYRFYVCGDVPLASGRRWSSWPADAFHRLPGTAGPVSSDNSSSRNVPAGVEAAKIDSSSRSHRWTTLGFHARGPVPRFSERTLVLRRLLLG